LVGASHNHHLESFVTVAIRKVVVVVLAVGVEGEVVSSGGW